MSESSKIGVKTPSKPIFTIYLPNFSLVFPIFGVLLHQQLIKSTPK